MEKLVYTTVYPIKLKNLNKAVSYGISNSDGKDWYCHIYNSIREAIGGFDFQYVHQLQNGIRLITDKYLEVKL